MAWQCTSDSNAGLIANLRRARLIISNEVERAMLAVDRGNYAPGFPYEDAPQRIGYDATISAPHMHAHALEILKPSLDKSDSPNVLDIGCGSGYLLACFARMKPAVHATGIEYVPELADLSRRNIAKRDADLFANGQIEVHIGNGWDGYEQNAPYDVIHVGAAAAHVPNKLKEQLKIGGTMVIPVGIHSQSLILVERTGHDSFVSSDLMGVRYVPLVDGVYKRGTC